MNHCKVNKQVNKQAHSAQAQYFPKWYPRKEKKLPEMPDKKSGS